MIVITGGAGFIGSSIISELNRRKERNIIVVDKRENRSRKNLEGLIFSSYIDKDEFIKNLKSFNPSCIIHLGAISDTTCTDRDLLIKNNFEWTKTLARFSMENNIRFIYASSAATYGDGKNGFSDSEDNIKNLKPLNLYGYSKHLFDLWALENGLLDKIVGLKYFNVYGEGEYHKGHMRSKVLKGYYEIKEKGRVFLFKSYREEYKDGEQKRDFIYIKDAVFMTLFFLENPKINGIFNIATGKSRTWNCLAFALFRALGKKPSIEYIDMPQKIRENYQYWTEGPISKIRKSGYSKELTSLEDGVMDYVNLLEEKYRA
ncbi:MAG: ADP-glyceromanno-heptose 6-epimerase [bacterium]